MFRFLQLYLIQQTSQQNGLLIIRNAQSVNTGEYFCTAINNQGRSVARIVINMIDRPTPFPGGEVQVSIIIMSYRTIITPSNAHTELYWHFLKALVTCHMKDLANIVERCDFANPDICILNTCMEQERIFEYDKCAGDVCGFVRFNCGGQLECEWQVWYWCQCSWCMNEQYLRGWSAHITTFIQSFSVVSITINPTSLF